MPRFVKDWSLTALQEKLIKVGAKVVHHARYSAFQLAEAAMPATPSSGDSSQIATQDKVAFHRFRS